MFFKKPVSSSLLAWEAAVLANVKDTAGIIYYRFSRRHWVGAFNLHRYNPVFKLTHSSPSKQRSYPSVVGRVALKVYGLGRPASI